MLQFICLHGFSIHYLHSFDCYYYSVDFSIRVRVEWWNWKIRQQRNSKQRFHINRKWWWENMRKISRKRIKHLRTSKVFGFGRLPMPWLIASSSYRRSFTLKTETFVRFSLPPFHLSFIQCCSLLPMGLIAWRDFMKWNTITHFFYVYIFGNDSNLFRMILFARLHITPQECWNFMWCEKFHLKLKD